VAQFGYLVDLTGIKFDDSLTTGVGGEVETWIQAAPMGKYYHPIHGEIEFTPERAKRFAQNVKAGVRGQDLNIDYDHKEGEAAGWVRDAEARSDGLYLKVAWTPTAVAQLREKKYRYFSPDFNDEWEHPATRVKYQDVMNGGALTNRPYLKGILPINLSEAFAVAEGIGRSDVKLEEVGVDPKLLRKLLGLAEDATDEQVATTLSERGLSADDLKPTEPQKKEDPPAQLSEGDKKVDEILATVKKLSESKEATAEVKQLAELVEGLGTQIKSQSETIATQGTALQLAEANARVATLLSEGDSKKFTLPPAVTDQLKEVMITAPKELSDKVFETFQKMLSEGLVPLTEQGSSHTERPGDEDAVKRFSEAVDKLQKEHKEKTGKELSYVDAVNSVSAMDPKLYSEYREASTAFRI